MLIMVFTPLEDKNTKEAAGLFDRTSKKFSKTMLTAHGTCIQKC